MESPNRSLIIVDDEPETLAGYSHYLSPGETDLVRRSSRKMARSGGSMTLQSAATPDAERYRLLLAATGEEAVELVRSELQADRRVAAGFFDVKLGAGMDGIATIQAIRELDPQVHCVIVTAYHDRSVEEINAIFGEEFKDQWDYLNKPFTQGEIVQKARQMISAWNRKRQLEVMNAQLIRSERLAGVGQVARGIGHEFGNILLRIVGKTDLSLMEKDVTKIHDHLKVVMRAAERAAVIVRNLQSFSRTEPFFQMEMISRPLDEALSLISHEFVKSSVEIKKVFLPVPLVRLDNGGLSQVFLNLLINAVHAMPTGGEIVLQVENALSTDGRPGVAARVIDGGSGIPADVLPRIFDFAFSTKGDRGSGLGLAISREIIKAHAGELTVATEVGKGSTFTVWLPSAAAYPHSRGAGLAK